MRKETQIVVIDDEKDICDLFKKVLTDEGYRVFTALDGESGIITVRTNRPDVVLLDLKLPRMDGIEVLQEIKKIDKNIVVILITGYGNMDTARMAMKFGAFDYITKPIDLEYVKEVIKDGLKLTLRSLVDRMKEKDIFGRIRSKKAKLDNIKHCKKSYACLWEIALKSFVLGDNNLMAEWITDPQVSKEEKLDLTRIAEVLKADMGKK